MLSQEPQKQPRGIRVIRVIRFIRVIRVIRVIIILCLGYMIGPLCDPSSINTSI